MGGTQTSYTIWSILQKSKNSDDLCGLGCAAYHRLLLELQIIENHPIIEKHK
jgi:hypothetical protein